MGSKIEYVDSSQIYATSYVRNSKAIGVLWAIFTICYAIIGMVCFVSPEWIGMDAGATNYHNRRAGVGSEENGAAEGIQSQHTFDRVESGRIGLWTECHFETATVTGTATDAQQSAVVEQCNGRLEHLIKFHGPPQGALRIASLLVGVSAAAALLTVCAILLFFFCHCTTVFHVCGWLQLISAISLVAGCATFPLGWTNTVVRRVCGSSDYYVLGDCDVRWAYVLAAIGCLDAIILSTLAFILATRHIRLQPDPHYAPPNIYNKAAELNNGFVGDSTSMAGSRKSLNLHPVLMMHPGQDDTYSQFSQRTVPRSVHSAHYGHHNFQL